ncbi:unnamed protein product [marine sediment metagenome]|uniref:Uncharacterized protein n=1 Tax=marine sediment metagenome TaxID=412755 RepID=X0VUU9_9ZZZZ
MKEKKQIYISAETHALLKQHCDKYAFVIQGWVDNLIRERLNKLKNQ